MRRRCGAARGTPTRRNTCAAAEQTEEEAAEAEAAEAAEAAAAEEEDEEDHLARARRRFAEEAATDELRGGEPIWEGVRVSYPTPTPTLTRTPNPNPNPGEPIWEEDGLHDELDVRPAFLPAE